MLDVYYNFMILNVNHLYYHQISNKLNKLPTSMTEIILIRCYDIRPFMIYRDSQSIGKSICLLIYIIYLPTLISVYLFWDLCVFVLGQRPYWQAHALHHQTGKSLSLSVCVCTNTLSYQSVPTKS